MALSPSGKENSVHLPLHVWSTDTCRWQQAGTGLMHCLQSHLSGSHCCFVTGSAGSIFSGFRLVPRRAQYLPRPAALGSGCCFRLSSGIETRGQRERRAKKGGPLMQRLAPKEMFFYKFKQKERQVPTHILISFLLWLMETIYSVQVWSNLDISHETSLYLCLFLGALSLVWSGRGSAGKGLKAKFEPKFSSTFFPSFFLATSLMCDWDFLSSRYTCSIRACLLLLLWFPPIPRIPAENPQRTGANTLHQLWLIHVVGRIIARLLAWIISP